MENQLDPTVINLAKAIRQTESGGDFTAKGKSGEIGGYQYTPDTWNAVAPKYGITATLDKATPEQQNAVTYNRIKEWKDKGHDVTEIASMWNAGEGEPTAYTGTFGSTTGRHKAGDPSVGVNQYGAKYDVPTYAKSVADAYLKLKQGQSVGADPNNPSSVANPQNQPDDVDTYGATFPASKSDSPLAAGLKATGNLPSSAISNIGGIINIAKHPINTIKGLGNAFAGGVEEGWNALTGGKSDDEHTQAFDNLKKGLYERYGTMENAQRTATNDPLGVGVDVLSILEGGAGLADRALGTAGVDLAKIAARKGFIPPGSKGITSGILNKGLTIPTDIGKTVLQKGSGFATDAAGKLIGVDGSALREGVNASVTGGKAYNAFKEGLTGNVAPDALVNQARDALGEVINNRSTGYQKMLSTLKGSNAAYDISPVLNEMDAQLQKFGVTKASDGTLDFSRSTLSDASDVSKVNQIYNDIKSWGSKAGDRTAIGVDTLKRRIGNYFSPTSDFRAMTTALRNKTRSVLDNAPGYTKEMKNYAELSDQIEDIRKGLSLGDNAMVETTFKKLTGAFRQNNEFRKQLIQELDDVTGGQLLPKIAGQQLSSWMPRGLAGVSNTTTGLMAGLATGTGLYPLLATAFATSPRIVGAFIQSLHLPAQAMKVIMDMLNKTAMPVAIGGNVINRATTSGSTSQEN